MEELKNAMVSIPYNDLQSIISDRDNFRNLYKATEQKAETEKLTFYQICKAFDIPKDDFIKEFRHKVSASDQAFNVRLIRWLLRTKIEKLQDERKSIENYDRTKIGEDETTN